MDIATGLEPFSPKSEIAPRDDVTGVILAGGQSSRMGRDKATLSVQGVRMFDRTRQALQAFFPNILIAGNRPDLASRQIPYYPDIYPGSALGGLYTGLYHATTPYVFALACDIPFPASNLIGLILEHGRQADVTVFRTREGFEPLFALYRKTCLMPMHTMLEKNNFRIYDLYRHPRLRVRYLDPQELSLPLGWERSLRNINTPDDYKALRGDLK